MDICPECEHRATQSHPNVLWTWIKGRMGWQPPKARCNWALTSVETGDGLPGNCGCTNEWHAEHYEPTGVFGRSIIEGLTEK